MGVSIGYQTRTGVTPETRASVLTAVASLVYPGGEPWCEPIHIYDDGRPSLWGAYKLFRMYTEPVNGHQEQIDFRDDSIMASIDLQFALAWLYQMAHAHELTWYLDIDGHEFGTIDREAMQGEVGDFADAMAQSGGATNVADALLRAPAIRSKYGIT